MVEWRSAHVAGCGTAQSPKHPPGSVESKGTPVKEKIHPRYQNCSVHCACGNTFTTRSTQSRIAVDICAACHPFFTGKQKFVDTAGRVDKFQQRMVKTQAAQAAAATRKKKK